MKPLWNFLSGSSPASRVQKNFQDVLELFLKQNPDNILKPYTLLSTNVP